MISVNQWAYDLEKKIFSIVKLRTYEKLKSKYPSVYITDIEKNTSKAVFPTVYIHELPGVEKASDLEGFSINAVQETFQIDVITNTSQNDANKVMAIVADEFKRLCFKVTAMPEFDGTGETYRSTMRVRRIISANDIF
nr:MAG TPA: PORTAL PROTEIN, 15 PROTEIN, HEAD PROTEIN, VIRAL INFECTION, TAILED.2A [Caudoviricetes sp.]